LSNLHEFLPLLIIVIILENTINIKGINNLIKNFPKNALLYSVLIIVFSLYLKFVAINGSVKHTITINSLSSMLAFLTPYWLFKIEQKSKFLVPNLFLLFIVLTAIFFSEVRGSLIIYIILLSIVVFKQLLTRKNIIVIPIIVIVGIVIIPYVNIESKSVKSIYELEKAWVFNSSVDYNQLQSGDLLRYNLWTEAKKVWMENKLIGIGTNQFKQNVTIGDREEAYTPHHQFLTIATNGGVIGIILLFLPLIYIYIKGKNKLSYYEKKYTMLTIFLFFVLAFFFGYSFNYEYIIILYIYGL